MTREPWEPTEGEAQFLVTRFLGATWRATLLFVIGIGGGALLLQFELSPSVEGAVLALLVTPLIWWWRVGRHGKATAGRGAVAGAVIVPMVWILGLAISSLVTEANRPPDWHPTREWAGFGTEFQLMVGLVGSLVGAASGAAYGAMVAWIERAWGRNPPPAGRRESK